MPDTTQEKTFFEDLIDRRFFQFIGTYLGVSFGLIQFAEFMENRYSPGFQLVDKMIIFLAVLLPAVIVFIYNHGRKGRDKWKPFERIFLPSNLVVALGMALFFFNSPPAGAATETVSITTEEGETTTRVVPKTEYTKRLVIFPFTNNTGDEDKDWLRVGGSYLLDKDIEQDMRIFSTQALSLKYYYESYNHKYLDEIPFSTQLKIAQEYYTDYFLVNTLESVEVTFKPSSTDSSVLTRK